MRTRTAPFASVTLALLVGLASGEAGTPAAPSIQYPPIFRFHADGFWLNLHGFLYVLGRAEAGLPDASRRAVAAAPGDSAEAMASFSDADRATWQKAVTFYADGPSRLDAVFDEALVAVTNAVAGLTEEARPDSAAIPTAHQNILREAAPIYRRAWWPAHRRANDAWVAAMAPLVAEHGRAVLAFITRVYGEPWPGAGYPVNLSAYCNWAGAYSTSGNLLVISSLDSGNTGPSALETVFHEAMHQWDDAIDRALARLVPEGRRVPGQLSHAMIFLTAGDAVRRQIPDYTPYADANGIWQRSLGVFKPALESAWRPWLDGTGTRDQALAALLAR